MRFNAGKSLWRLIPWDGLELGLKVLEFGAQKYAAFNWEKGLSWSETAESLLRHTQKWIRREELDPESKISHVGHILCNALFLAAFVVRGTGTDDRPPAIAVAAPQVPAEPRRPQVGDRVRLLATGHPGHDPTIVGATGSIVEDDGTSVPFQIRLHAEPDTGLIAVVWRAADAIEVLP
jgi:hypothetical protein